MRKLGKMLIVVAVLVGNSKFLNAAETTEPKDVEQSILCKILPFTCSGVSTMSNGSGNEPPKK